MRDVNYRIAGKRSRKHSPSRNDKNVAIGHASWVTEWEGGLREDESARHPFDLEERTTRFSEAIIDFLKKVPRGPLDDRLIGQLAGCAPAVGANYLEANDGVSKKDFRLSISRCVKEAKEAKYFIRLIAKSEPLLRVEARQLWSEAKELHLIFASMLRK